MKLTIITSNNFNLKDDKNKIKMNQKVYTIYN